MNGSRIGYGIAAPRRFPAAVSHVRCWTLDALQAAPDPPARSPHFPPDPSVTYRDAGHEVTGICILCTTERGTANRVACPPRTHEGGRAFFQRG